MAMIRRTEIHGRRVRKMKLHKLRGRYASADTAGAKEKILEKAARVAPWVSKEEFLAPIKK